MYKQQPPRLQFLINEILQSWISDFGPISVKDGSAVVAVDDVLEQSGPKESWGDAGWTEKYQKIDRFRQKCIGLLCLPPFANRLLDALEGAFFCSLLETCRKNFRITTPLRGQIALEASDYLDRQGIVTRVSPNRFAIAENDRWAEPLEENFSRVLARNLSILLQTDRIVAYPWVRSQQPTYQVQVEVLRFEPNAEQIVELWGRWSIIEGTNKTVSVKETYLTRPTRDKSTEASVAALSETVADLSREIAGAIRNLEGGKRSSG